MRLFVPEVCEAMLVECGATFDHPAEVQLGTRPQSDTERSSQRRYPFPEDITRNSGVTDNVIKLKLGAHENLFRRLVLPSLLKHGVIRRTDYRGSGAQERYELAFPVDTILAGENPSGTAPAGLKAFWSDLRRP